MLLFFKNLLFTVLVPGTFAVLIPLRMAAARGQDAGEWQAQQFLSLLLLLSGAAIYLRCVWDFAVTGRGTPAPVDAPKVLVVRGLYRYVRNPMYIGVLLVVIGWAVFFGVRALLFYAAAGAAFFSLFVVFVEEPILRKKFGDPYERYCHEVRRWLPGRPYEESK